MDYDSYLDKQIEMHYAEQEYNMPVSNCCGVYIYENDDICPECYEHCEVISHGEYEYIEHDNAMCDKADSDRDLAREE